MKELFPLPANWHWTRFGDVARVVSKLVDPADYQSVAHIAPNHIEASTGRLLPYSTVLADGVGSAKKEFRAGQILYSKIRPYLAKAALVDFDGVCSADMYPIDTSLDSSYLHRWMLTPEFTAAASQNQGRNLLPKINAKELSSLPVPVPPASIQKQIATLLGHADTLRAKRREAIALLDKLAQSIFLDTFGDPRENPFGWQTKTLAELADQDDRINYGVVQPGDDYEGGVPLVRVGDIANGRVDRTSIKKIDPRIEAKYSRSRITGNEVLVGCVGSIGSVALVSESDIGSNVARAVARIPVSSGSLREYVAEHLRTAGTQRYFMSELRTVAQPTLNIKQLSETVVMDPPSDLQAEFALRVAMVRKHRLGQARHLALLDSLFASLQHRAFRGEPWTGGPTPTA